MEAILLLDRILDGAAARGFVLLGSRDRKVSDRQKEGQADHPHATDLPQVARYYYHCSLPVMTAADPALSDRCLG